MKYLGCKTNMLKNIEKVLEENCPNEHSFCDLFSGTGTVARHFKSKYKTSTNDFLYFSYCLQMAFMQNNTVPKFSKLKAVYGIDNPLNYFNQMDIECLEKLINVDQRFIQNNYSPIGGRMYVTEENGLRIDVIRNTIQQWYKEEVITQSEYYYLLATLLMKVPDVSNISGTYGAYYKHWNKNAVKSLVLVDVPITSNAEVNTCYNEDATQLVKRLQGDILYLDPPYNERQYNSNYHLLETIARYDNPELRGVTGLRKENENVSKFCSKRMVELEFEELIKNSNFKHIVLSYSSEGLLSLKTIETIFKKYGKKDTMKTYAYSYKRFKSNKNTDGEPIIEYLIYLEKEGDYD